MRAFFSRVVSRCAVENCRLVTNIFCAIIQLSYGLSPSKHRIAGHTTVPTSMPHLQAEPAVAQLGSEIMF